MLRKHLLTSFLLFLNLACWGQKNYTEIVDDYFWVDHIYNEIKNRNSQIYLGYIDVINRSVRNERTVTKGSGFSGNAGFASAKKIREAWDTQQNPNRLPNHESPSWDFVSIVPYSDLAVGLLKINNRRALQSAVDQVDYYKKRNYGYTPVATAFSGSNGWNTWTEDQAKSVLMEFRNYAKINPKFKENADMFLSDLGVPSSTAGRHVFYDLQKFGYKDLMENYFIKLDLSNAELEGSFVSKDLALGVNRDLLKKIEEIAESINADLENRNSINNSEFKKRQEQIVEIQAWFKVVATLTTLKDPELGNRISDLGKGSTQMLEGMNQVSAENAFSMAAGSNILSGALLVYSAFQNGGKKSEIAILSDQVKGMEEKILARLDGIDSKLTLIRDDLQKLNREISGQFDDVKIEIKVVNAHLQKISKTVSQTESLVHSYFSDLKESELFDLGVETVNRDKFVNRPDITEDAFLSGVEQLLKLVLRSSESTAIGTSLKKNDFDSYKRRFGKFTPETNIQILADYSRHFDNTIPEELANPIEWEIASSMMLEFLSNWPEYTSEVRSVTIEKIIEKGSPIQLFAKKIDRVFLEEKFFTTQTLTGKDTSLLRLAIKEVGEEEESLINEFMGKNGEFIPIDSLSTRGFSFRIDSVYEGRNDYHVTLSNWRIPLRVNAFSTFIPSLENDWDGWGRQIYSASTNNGDLEAPSIISLIPYFQRNASIFQKVKYSSYRFQSQVGPAHGVILYRDRPPDLMSYIIPQPPRHPGSGLILSFGGPGHTLNLPVALNRIDAYDLNNRSVNRFIPIYSRHPSDFDVRIRQLYTNIDSTLKSKIRRAVDGEHVFRQSHLIRLIEQEEMMVLTLRSLLVLFYNEEVFRNGKLYNKVFSDSAYVVRNNFIKYSLASDADLLKVEKTIINQFEDLQKTLVESLFENANTTGRIDYLNTTLLKLHLVKDIINKKQKVPMSPFAANRLIKKHLERK